PVNKRLSDALKSVLENNDLRHVHMRLIEIMKILEPTVFNHFMQNGTVPGFKLVSQLDITRKSSQEIFEWFGFQKFDFERFHNIVIKYGLDKLFERLPPNNIKPQGIIVIKNPVLLLKNNVILNERVFSINFIHYFLEFLKIYESFNEEMLKVLLL